MKKIALSKLDELFAAISENQTLISAGGERRAGGLRRVVARGEGAPRRAQDRQERQGRVLSPGGGHASASTCRARSIRDRSRRVHETEDFVLFGVRACDARSFELLDRVFLSDPVDHLLRRPPRPRNRGDAGVQRAGGDTASALISASTRRTRQGDASAWIDGGDAVPARQHRKGRDAADVARLLEDGG